ncbi:MAG: heme lyase CcmF/NrfE family subunit [Acidobacteria bacterium]|nr:heme lyase CcmF/NrfE family subunit [Acidobacteriota bacterium]
MANFGNFCLILSLCLSLYALIAALVGISQRQPRIIRSAENAAYSATGIITLTFLSLVYLLATDDFSVAHVASTSNRALPIFYKVAAVWGAHDGSMLLWVFVASIFSGLAIYQNRRRYREMMPYVLAVLMVNLSFFLLLNLFFSNPFHRLVQVFADGSAGPFLPADGQGLNPILQHWAMVIHPPIQYLGFIGFVVPFAFAIAALCSKQMGDTWIRTTRRWTLLTWIFLGVGLILGGKWAYVVLGWGGYWAWDPVENSSLMPWLISTAFLHSVIVQERKGMLKVWNIILVVLAYLLGVFGTFLTRSGVVSSVHAFADSNLGKFFLIYMAGVLAASLYLVIDRRDYLKSERRLDSILSRESAFLFNNLVLVVACFAVFWGTMFPVFSEWVRGVKITVGPPFFNNINIPIGLLLLFLTGVGPLFAWRKTSPKSLRRSFLWPVIFSAATCFVIVAAGMRNFYAVCCLTLCAFVLIVILEEFIKGTFIRIRKKGENPFSAFVNLTLKNKRRYGGYIVHFSIVLMFVGFTGNTFNREATRQMEPGGEMEIGDYSLKMTGYEDGQTANYDFGKVVLDVYRNGKVIGTLKPERRIFKTGSGQMTTTVALHSTPKEDLYVVFAGMSHDGSTFEIRANVNPLVYWIWFGAAMMVFGTIITLLPNKRSVVGSRQ